MFAAEYNINSTYNLTFLENVIRDLKIIKILCETDLLIAKSQQQNKL